MRQTHLQRCDALHGTSCHRRTEPGSSSGRILKSVAPLLIHKIDPGEMHSHREESWQGHRGGVKSPALRKPEDGAPRTNGPDRGQTMLRAFRTRSFVLRPVWKKPREQVRFLSWYFQLAFVRFQGGPRFSIFHEVS